MERTVNAKELRRTLPEVVSRVRKGDRYLVMYRSRPAFRIVGVEPSADDVPLSEDPLFGAGPLGRTSDGLTASDSEALLYGSGSAEK